MKSRSLSSLLPAPKPAAFGREASGQVRVNVPCVPSRHDDEAADGVRQRPTTHDW